MSNNLVSILLGDNPFFGVDHLSQDRARQKAKTSQNFDNALKVIKYSFNMGVNGMVVSTHPTLKNLIEKIREDSDLINNMNFYPIIPEVQGYVLKINEQGMVKTLTDILSQAGIRTKIKFLTKGGIGILRKDLSELIKIIIDVELLQLKNTKIKSIFLSDAITDLALALGMKNVFQIFQSHVENNYNVQAGFVTKNFPRLIDRFKEWNLSFPIVMTSFNKAGFQMNPSKDECEQYLQNYDVDVIAMSVLAAGFLKIDDAFEYISSLKKIKHVVLGISSIEHAKKTIELFSKNYLS